MSRRSDIPLRADFPWSCKIKVDPAQADQRHVDNVALSQIFHEARLDLNTAIILRTGSGERFSDQMIVNIATDFAAEVHFEPKLDVYARIGRVGRSSYDIDLAIFVGEAPAVRCTTVCVWVANGVPCPISGEARDVLLALA